jgi:flavin reductase (DIM6/NTAB) family NADH-FMN oxidoreductase RutF
MFKWLTKNAKRKERFVDSPIRDNWYQANSYYPLPFALVTTVDDNDNCNIGPHSFTMPYGVISDYSVVLITRFNSNTAVNLSRTKKCALNFIEWDKKQLREVVGLGYPGQTTAEKMQHQHFTFIDSPTAGRQSGDGIHPPLIKEAFQAYECTWDESVDYNYNASASARHFILKLDNILLKESWKKNLDDGNPEMPNMPISYGFRDGKDFWFSKHRKPFSIATPTDRGPKVEAVFYTANRLDDEVKFTRQACEKLTGVPRVFLKTALNGIIKRAREEGLLEVDEAFVDRINKERNG